MEKNGASRLMQMQARFQQKQMQEREMKIANLYEAQQARALDRVRQSPSNLRHSPSNGVNGVSNGSTVSSPSQPVSHQPGKVRQMFEERRTKAGIDKSYPLQPIHNTDKRKALPNGYSKVTATSHATSKVTANSHSTSKISERTTRTRVTATQHNVKKINHKTDNIVNGAGDLNHNHEPDLNSLRHALPRSNGEPIIDEVDKNENLLEDETFPDALAPAATPRSPEPIAPRQEIKPPPRRNPAARSSPPKTKPQPHAVTPSRRVISENTVTETSRARGAMHKGASPTQSVATRRQPVVSSPRFSATGSATKPRSAVASSAADAGEACTVCGRRFAPDRLEKHQEICKKSHAKKRKPFDALKHRLAGTEAEPFINKLRKNTNSSTKLSKPLNSTWRQKHEEFIQAIRAAKEVQAHLASGGKLSDLPPPPPSENPDYVACPHCGRRFNQGAAERHIPKCKNFQFNKPKPAPKKR